MTQLDLTPISLFGSLPIARYRIIVRLATPLPGHMGSAWRGLIGWELKRLICPFVEKRVCKPFIIRNHCSYFRLFEDQSPVSGIQEMPRGYIFAPTDSNRSCTHHLNITLIGDCLFRHPGAASGIPQLSVCRWRTDRKGRLSGFDGAFFRYHTGTARPVLDRLQPVFQPSEYKNADGWAGWNRVVQPVRHVAGAVASGCRAGSCGKRGIDGIGKDCGSEKRESVDRPTAE